MILSFLILYLSYALIFAFATVCLAAGLFYIAETIEEYTVLTKRILRYTIYAIVVIHALLLIFENLPPTYVGLGLISHVIYLLPLKDFPAVELLSYKFLLAALFVVVDHALWFYYFTHNYWEYQQIVAFFVVCVWLVPFIYFISLSANESTLPFNFGGSNNSEEVSADDFTYPLGGKKRGKRSSTFLTLLNLLKKKAEAIIPSRSSQKLF